VQALDIYVDDAQQRGFRRRAIRAFHKGQEYIEAVFIRRGLGEFHVERFVPLIITHAGRKIVNWDETQYNALKNEAKNLGLEFGTIHTHIVTDSAPSKYDHVESVAAGELLVGVCEIEKTKSGRAHIVTLDFWQPQLPAKLHVIRRKK
jgi:Fe-S oxidoreductase